MLSSNNRNKLISLLEHRNYQAAGNSFIIYPDNLNTLGQIIKLSNRFGIKIVVIGNGSTFDSSFIPPENSVFLSTQRLNSVIFVDKNDMFAEFQAGCRWKTEFGKLKNEGFEFPINLDSVNEKRTVGGIFSSLKPGSYMSNHFTGIEFLTSDGTQIRYGSKTLKNVAGYDLVKFMAGNSGCFGVITSVTLRLFSSEETFYKPEDLSDISLKENYLYSDQIYKNLRSELDPNEVFYRLPDLSKKN
jgi:FAD/FMN-containing dehydrogenase